MQLTVLLLCFLPVLAQHTYYVSKSAGADSNTSTQAQSKGTPWAHLKGMRGATSNASSYSPVAGDKFVLMGCDEWVYTDLPIKWDWSGSSGSPITITVDKTWYNRANCPSSWNRPIWDAGKVSTCWAYNTSGIPNVMLTVADTANSVSHVTFDNIELRGMEINAVAGCRGGQGYGDYIFFFNPVSNVTLSNLYIHGWQSTVDNCIIVQAQANNTFTNGVIDGSDGTGSAAGESCYAFYPTPPDIKNSVIHDLPNGIVGYAGGGSGGTAVTVSGNLIYNISNSFEGSNHCNMVEWVGGGTYYFYDNVLHDVECRGGEAYMAGNDGETDYVWNNVFYNLNLGQGPNFPQQPIKSGTVSMYWWNNTIVANTGLSCFYNSGQGTAPFANLVVQNTHCITKASRVVGGLSANNLVTTPNTLMTPTTATRQGYTSSEVYAHSPINGCTPSTCNTMGAGTNLTSTCLGNVAGLCTDTTYACTQQTINRVVQSVCPARTTKSRPSNGAWDSGAYHL